MKSNWQEEVAKFRAWAATQDHDEIEWETAYGEDGWDAINASVADFLSSSFPQGWTRGEIEDLLYLLSLYGWAETAASLKRNLTAALRLAAKSLSFTGVEPKSRCELAEVLGYLSPSAEVEALLLRFVDDDDETVRRYALRSLARVGSAQTEVLALREWHREHPNQQWACMMALACWHHLGSSLLESHLREAEVSPFVHLSYFARNLRNGELEPW